MVWGIVRIYWGNFSIRFKLIKRLNNVAHKSVQRKSSIKIIQEQPQLKQQINRNNNKNKGRNQNNLLNKRDNTKKNKNNKNKTKTRGYDDNGKNCYISPYYVPKNPTMNTNTCGNNYLKSCRASLTLPWKPKALRNFRSHSHT